MKGGRWASTALALLALAEYPTGPQVEVVARLAWCGDLGAGNGTVVHQMSSELADIVAGLAGNTTGWAGSMLPG